VLLKFRSKVLHLRRRVFQHRGLTRGRDRVFARVSRHAQNRIRIEDLLRVVDERSAAPAALVLFPGLLLATRFAVLTSHFFLLPKLRGLFFTRRLTPLLVITCGFGRRGSGRLASEHAALMQTVRGRLPETIGGLSPAFGTQVAGLRHVVPADAALVHDDDRDAPALHRQRSTAAGGE
jgi:hypothetical protein